MKALEFVPSFSDPQNKSHLWRISIALVLTISIYFIGSTLLSEDYRHILPTWKLSYPRSDNSGVLPGKGLDSSSQKTRPDNCKNQCRPVGSEALPEGIVTKTSDLQMRPLWGHIENKQSKPSQSLLAVPVGIKQRFIVNQTVEKFLESSFVVMLFHYDGVVDEWREFGWNDRVLHVSAINQTKWWFAKRFLHPDIVAEYDYIFLWDEDLGLDFFHPQRYLSIIKKEGLEISQPALDSSKSEVHHPITSRKRNSTVHRRFYKLKGSGRCYKNSTSPRCTGWVEMMAPVFSRAAWRCSWHMIQNDLIHAWGLDVQLGYCAQGDRTRNVGVVDSEYIIHLDVHTLGVTFSNVMNNNSSSQTNVSSDSNVVDSRLEVSSNVSFVWST